MRIGDTLRITAPRPPSGPVDYGAIAREAAEEALRGAHLDSWERLWSWLSGPPARAMETIPEQCRAAANNAAGNAAMAVRDALSDEMDRLQADNQRLRERIKELRGNDNG